MVPNLEIKKLSLAVAATLVVFLLMPVEPSFQTTAADIFDADPYTYNDSPTLSVFDPTFDGNLDDPDYITVKLTSDDDPEGFMVILTETDNDSKFFQNDVFSFKVIRFLNGANFIPEGSNLLITYSDPDFIGAGSVFVGITSSSEDFFENQFELTETPPGSGIFQNELTIADGPIDTTDNVLQSAAGDTFAVLFPCGDNSNWQIPPRADVSTFGGIQVNPSDPPHKVYVEYTNDLDTFVDSASVDESPCGSGGSGGGLVINRVVLDVLGGTSGGDFAPPLLTIPKLNLSSLPLVGDMLDFILNADPFTVITPLDDPSIDYPLSINGNGYLLTQFANTIQTYTGKTGEPVSFKMTLSDATGVEHIALYTNLRGDAREVQDSDTFITYNEDKPIEITDPHGFFSNVNFTESEYNGKYIASFDMTFAKPMDTSDIIIRTWDELRNSGDIKVLDAMKIEGEPIVNPDTNNLVVPESSSITIPYYKLPYYEIPNADSEGNLIYYNSFGGLEEKQAQPYHTSTVYPTSVGRAERHDNGFQESIIHEGMKAQDLAQRLVDNPFTPYENKQDEIKFIYPTKVGKLDRENKDELYDTMMNEFVKASKIFAQHYKTNHLAD